MIEIIEAVEIDGVRHVRIMHLIPATQCAELADATTDSATTPSAADSRAIARPIGLALRAAVADGSLVLP
jgi:hypothetical protein